MAAALSIIGRLYIADGKCWSLCQASTAHDLHSSSQLTGSEERNEQNAGSEAIVYARNTYRHELHVEMEECK